jgi:GNAT superfamily N-acetyltransferase
MLERRAAAAEDERFLRELYASTRPEVAALEEEAREVFLDLQFRAQERGWRERFPGSVHELILLDGAPAGRVWVAWREDECRIVDLSLLPGQRRSGIGTQVLGEVFAEADRRRVPVRATVEQTNLASLAFTARLGFVTVGEDVLHVEFERPVSAARPPRASG